MADQLILFGYFYRPSAVHRLEARCKLLCLAVFAVSTLGISAKQGNFMGLAALGLLLAVVWLASGLPVRLFARQSRLLLLWLPLAALVPAFTIPGQPLANNGILQMASRQGCLYGLDFACKMGLFWALGLLFTATTTASQLSRAVAALLRPFPAKIAATVSAMMGLIFAQAPALFAAYRQINQAQQARLAHTKGIKGIMKRGKQLLLPFLQQVFIRSDALVVAMEARCFNYRRTLLQTPVTLPDVAYTTLFCCCCMAVLWLHCRWSNF